MKEEDEQGDYEFNKRRQCTKRKENAQICGGCKQAP